MNADENGEYNTTSTRSEAELEGVTQSDLTTSDSTADATPAHETTSSPVGARALPLIETPSSAGVQPSPSSEHTAAKPKRVIIRSKISHD
jgi:hypothetical protein